MDHTHGDVFGMFTEGEHGVKNYTQYLDCVDGENGAASDSDVKCSLILFAERHEQHQLAFSWRNDKIAILKKISIFERTPLRCSVAV